MGMITLHAADGHRLQAYQAQAAGTPLGALVVLPEIFGVNAHIRAVVDGFAAQGWLAIAPALFDRVEHGVEIGYAPADIERGKALKAACSNEQALLDIAAAAAAVRGAGRLCVVGYCWGGTLAWLAACSLPGLSAAVSYYGSGVAALASLTPRCPVQAHYGERDASIPLADVEVLRRAHPEVDVHVYPAGHGFNCDHRAAYDAPSAALARERTLRWLRTGAR